MKPIELMIKKYIYFNVQLVEHPPLAAFYLLPKIHKPFDNPPDPLYLVMAF